MIMKTFEEKQRSWIHEMLRREGTKTMPRTTRILAGKAAAISSAMLTRRKSSGAGLTTDNTKLPIGNGSTRTNVARESVAVLAEMLAFDTSVQTTNTAFFCTNMCLGNTLLKLVCFLSMASICTHTPATVAYWPKLQYVLLGVDIFVTVVFTIEALMKIYFSRNTKTFYFSDRWCQFNFILLIFHYLSIGVQSYELICKWFPLLKWTYYPYYGMVRAARPFIMIRLVFEFVKFKLPKNRIKQIIKRSSQQIQNVTIFFLFFMALYAIMGVQLFGRLEYHCVLPGTNPENVTIADLAIPDTKCSAKGGGGYECPDNMECMKLKLTAHQQGYYGMFNDFAKSGFSVYLAASEEGWVYVLYDCLDSFPSYIAIIYFITLIFLLAWLVKNVFIAVITETFAEIRVQFSEHWQKTEWTEDDGFHQRLERADDGWKLITLDAEIQQIETPNFLHQIVRAPSFQTPMMFLVLLNAVVNASFVYYHDESDVIRRKIYYFIEVGFTVLFNLEAIFKIIGLSWTNYIRRGQHKFELILCIGTTLNVVPFLYDTNVFTYFQVFRITRLIKASPMLEHFVYKIFGPGKKLGSLVFFTMILLIISSAISMQLFCYVPHMEKFRTFPQAFMCMFQIITQEGWTDILVEVMRETNSTDWIVCLVAAYFVGYHLLVTLIVLSLFVAVILDNLEMDEELKKVKQLKAREETTSMRTILPWRLRIFEKFPSRPQMVTLKRIHNDFPVPKVRASFTRQFAENALEDNGDISSECQTQKRLLKLRQKMNAEVKEFYIRQTGQLSSKSCVRQLIDESNKSRLLLLDANQFITQRTGPTRGNKREHSGRNRPRGLNTNTSFKVKAIYQHLKENGDARLTDSAPKANLKQEEIDIKALQQRRAHAEFTRNRIEEEMRENHPFFDRPLFAIGRDSKFRKLCQDIVYAKYSVLKVDPITGKTIQIKYKQLHSFIGMMTYLDWTMVVITLISCVSMLFESPWPTTGENLIFSNPYLRICEYIFVLAMTMELSLKIFANGLFFTTQAVLRDVGGGMTIFIYVTSVWYLLWMPKHVEINSLAQLLMIFRAMRPLRIYTLVPHIRRVVVELCKGFKEIMLVTILQILLMLAFASFGVQIAGGRLASCNDPSITSKENCTGVYEQKLLITRTEVYGKHDENMHPKILVPRVWSNPQNFNFDHVGNAMLALFETLSYKGWNVIRDILWMRRGPWAVVFIHVYVFMGCMIGLTLFVGVVVANYMENRGTALLTVDQRRWHDLKARLRMAQPLHIPPKPDESVKWRNFLYELTMWRQFKQFFSILVLAISSTLVIPWNVEEEKERKKTLFYATVVAAICNILFTVEVVLKIIAFTFRGFWQSKRNRVDLLITVLGLIWIFLHFPMTLPAKIMSAKTSLRRFTYTFGYFVVISRFFTIAGRKSTLKMLMMTVLMSLFRSLFIITAMFLLVLFYAYTGVILFGMVKYGYAISKHVNFRTAREALVVLFRSVTGEDWNDIMHAIASSSPPFCYWKEGINYWETDCGNFHGAVIYFCSFYIIITYVVLNVLVAIIMENFSLFYSSEEDALLSYADIRNFQLVWNMVDIQQKGYIPVSRVKFLLRLLKGRLEVDPTKDKLLFKHMCHEMERLHNGNDVSFHDILNMLSYRSVDIRKSLQLEELLQREELEYIIEEEVAKTTIRSWLEKCLKRIKLEKQINEKSLIAQVRGTPMASSTLGNSLVQRVSLVEAGLALNQFTETALINLPLRRESIHEEIINEPAIEEKAKKGRNRRSSIPDLVGVSFQEAKKFMWGSKNKPMIPNQSSMPDRPFVAVNKESLEKPLYLKRLEKRATIKQFTMATCDLPDLDEFAEEEEKELLEERYLSLDNLPVISKDTGLNPGDSTYRALYNESTTTDIHSWWSNINKK